MTIGAWLTVSHTHAVQCPQWFRAQFDVDTQLTVAVIVFRVRARADARAVIVGL